LLHSLSLLPLHCKQQKQRNKNKAEKQNNPHLVLSVLRQQVERANRQPELAAVREPPDGRAQVHELVPGDTRGPAHERSADVVDAVAMEAEDKGVVVVFAGRRSVVVGGIGVFRRRWDFDELADVFPDVLVQLLEDSLRLL